MKIILTPPKSLRGNTLILTIVVTGLVGFLLASYMGLVKSQNIATMRSQAWNATIPVIEAGLEEGLTHINTQVTNELATNGWTRHGNLWATKRWVGSNYYSVTISNWVAGAWTNHPVVEARGHEELHRHGASDAFDHAGDARMRARQRHAIGNARDAFGRLEVGLQHEGVGPVPPSGADHPAGGRDAPRAVVFVA